MAEENTSKIKEIENCFDTNPQEMAMSEEGSMETVIVKDVGNVEDVISVALKECVSKTKEVPKPPSVSSRRHSTGWIGTRAAGKPEVQSRYLGNHHVPSTHDLCKHGKLRDDAVKPWKVVRRTSIAGSMAVKVETSTSGLRRTSLGSVSRQIPAGNTPESCAVVKRDALAVKKKQCGSVYSETSSVKEEREMARSVDGLRVRSNDKARKKNKGTETTLSGGSSAVEKVIALGSEKPRSYVYTPKNKDKAKAQTIIGEDVKEKTVRVVEASVVKGVQSDQKQPSSEKKTMRSRLKSLTTPPTERGSAYHSPPTKQVPGTVLNNKKKESVDAELVAKKIKPKKTGVKVTLAKQLSSRKKTLEPKLEDAASPRKKKKKRNLKGVETVEGSKREKVVLRRGKVEGKKMMTLFNNVIEETMSKLTKVRKTKVKALIGAFETVISLQDTKTPQSKEGTSSESKVSPLGSKQ
ncbi:hypothetical protein Bca52824_070637 [Brassica carinata]|uniref:Calmodulin-binding domain-containing protein n=1 Tax=Brassica carinata TaxID=52824 RepID=A0A8X7Q5Q9_BRACI|nr:hypothetical protein Bca52824_070637 [Brassica carinata]